MPVLAKDQSFLACSHITPAVCIQKLPGGRRPTCHLAVCSPLLPSGVAGLEHTTPWLGVMRLTYYASLLGTTTSSLGAFKLLFHGNNDKLHGGSGSGSGLT